MPWNDLTLSDKARMIQLAVSSGITDLDTIQEVYNTYANGGDKATLSNKKYNAKQERAMWNYLKNRELSDAQAAGVLGNLAVESYLNADLHQYKGPAYGLIQAEAGRQRAMKNHHDTPYLFGSKLTPEEQQQLDYIIDKGINSYTPGEWGRKGFSGARQARQAFLDAQDVNAASDIFTYNYLRPGKPQVDRRRAMSSYYYDKYHNPYEIPLDWNKE